MVRGTSRRSAGMTMVPVCEEYNANLVIGVGELSVTACRRLITRVAETRRPARIFYISDFDPAGQSMPVAIARKAEWLALDKDLDIRLYPIVLNAEQIAHYNLPRVPIKESGCAAGSSRPAMAPRRCTRASCAGSSATTSTSTATRLSRGA